MRLSNNGFTLPELMLAALILLFCLVGLLGTYVQMFFLSDLARDFATATNIAEGKIEEIRNYAYTNANAFNMNSTDYLVTHYNGMIFNVSGFNATGRVMACDRNGCASEVSNLTDLIKIDVEVSFMSRGRLIGEDSNLNGVLNTGEDVNNNSRLDSPAEKVTLLAK